jgi:hypothetical protein
MTILEMYLKVKYCEMNKLSNLHIAISIYNPRKLPKRWSTDAKTALTALVTVEIW